MNGKQLKNSILQWAIQGKLVPQDPNDEPASVLLERIRQEKERLIKEKKIKRDKNASIIYRGEDNSYYEKFLATGEVKCIDDEIPFEIPQGWKWTRLRNIIIGTNAGKSPNCEKRPKKKEEWGVLTTTAIQEYDFLPIENKVLPQNYNINLEHCVKYGDILITRAGPVNRTGIVCLVDKECDKLILSDKTVRIDYIRGYCNPAYIVFVLNSPAIHELLLRVTVGMAKSQVNVSQENIQNTLIPLPCINEQNRIVSKIIKLLPIITRYESKQKELEGLNTQLATILQKSILQEAIQGKLVPQITEEGTAQELLEQIRQEKQKLLKEGKLKKSALTDSVIFKGDDNKYFEKKGKTEKDITEEIPFEIPDSWAWVRLSSISDIIGGYAFQSTSLKEKQGKRVIRISDFSEQGFVNTKIVRYDGTPISDIYKLRRFDILMAMTGGTVGKSLFIRELPETEILLNQRVARIRSLWINVDYLYFVIKAPHVKEFICKQKNSTNDNISMTDISNFIIPLPPIKEQIRIVKKLYNLASIMRR